MLIRSRSACFFWISKSHLLALGSNGNDLAMFQSLRAVGKAWHISADHFRLLSLRSRLKLVSPLTSLAPAPGWILARISSGRFVLFGHHKKRPRHPWRVMPGPIRIAEPPSAEKQRSSLLGLKKHEMKIRCPVARIIELICGSRNNACESLPLFPSPLLHLQAPRSSTWEPHFSAPNYS